MFQILVVEDDASLRRLMKAALKQHGYQPFTANDGVEALDVLEKTNIDLIISDVMMPNMDGYELTRQLRSADYQLPVLMVTAITAHVSIVLWLKLMVSISACWILTTGVILMH